MTTPSFKHLASILKFLFEGNSVPEQSRDFMTLLDALKLAIVLSKVSGLEAKDEETVAKALLFYTVYF
jgi:hypothetical protein